MPRNRMARSCCSNSRAEIVHQNDKDILAEIAFGLFALALLLGVPNVMAVLKTMGVW